MQEFARHKFYIDHRILIDLHHDVIKIQFTYARAVFAQTIAEHVTRYLLLFDIIIIHSINVFLLKQSFDHRFFLKSKNMKKEKNTGGRNNVTLFQEMFS